MLRQLQLILLAALSITHNIEGLLDLKDEYPFAFRLFNTKDSKPICGATLITPTCVLTTGHCVVEQKLEDLIVERDNKKIERQIERFIIPTDYKLTSQLNDLDFGIIVLKEAISYDDAQTVVIDFKPLKTDDPINIIGWTNRNKGDDFESLKTKVATSAQCLEHLPSSTEAFFCVPTDTGPGSSGRSALNEKNQQVGIVSFSGWSGGGEGKENKHTYFIRFSNPQTIAFFNETILRNCNGANNLP